MAFGEKGDFLSVDNKNTENADVNYYGNVSSNKNYIKIKIIVMILFLIVGVTAFLFSYKSTIVDPIENIKKTFIDAHLITIAVFLILTFIINFSSKNEEKLVKRLTVFSAISIITMLIFFGIKLNLDLTYTNEKFGRIFIEQSSDPKSSSNYLSKTKMDIGLNGITMKTEKEYYADECMKLYNIFKIKTYSILGLHLLLNLLLIYQISRVLKLKEKKEKINRVDDILFDEEENVKF